MNQIRKKNEISERRFSAKKIGNDTETKLFSGLEPIRTYHDANVTFLNKKIDEISK